MYGYVSILLCIFITFLSDPKLIAQTGWNEQESGTTTALRSVFMLDQSNGFVAGDSGIILKTTNGGTSWEKLNTGNGRDFYAVQFVNGNTGWAAGQEGTIIKTESGGDIWNEQSSGTDATLWDVFFATEKVGWCAGDNGMVLKTENGGEEWTALETNSTVNVLSITFNTAAQYTIFTPFRYEQDVPYAIATDSESNLYISISEGGQGVLKKMYKDGTYEYISEHTSFLKANSLVMSPDNNLFAAATLGRPKYVIKIDMNGNETYYANLVYAPLAIDMDVNQKIWVSGENYISRIDSAQSVTDFDFPGIVRAVKTVDDTLYIAGFIEGEESVWKIPHLASGQLGEADLVFNINTYLSGDIPEINDLEISEEGNIYLGLYGVPGLMVIDIQGNASFPVPHIMTGPVYDLSATSPSLLYISRQPSHLAEGAIIGIDPFFTAPLKGWAVGEEGSILKTTDGGENWVVQTSQTDSDLYSIYAADSLSAWICGENGIILRTADGGQSWEIVHSEQGQTLNSVYYQESVKGWIAGDGGTLLVSEDHGMSWVVYEKTPSADLNDIFFLTEDQGWMVADGGKIYHTESGGSYPPPVEEKHGWLPFGSLHNWFSSRGCEIEVGRDPSAAQQDGLQWPGIYDYMDMQCSKGLWLGTKNHTDQSGQTHPTRVIAVGPRESGENYFTPVDFRMISKHPIPAVSVQGVTSFNKPILTSELDPSQLCEHMLYNEVNTLLGLTMKRRIMQFTTTGHDNYIVHDYTFINSGNTDSDPVIELNGQMLDSLYIFYLYRWAVCRETRFIIGNPTGWGTNTMLSARGDGDQNVAAYQDPEDERFRAQYGWHGYFPDKVVTYDNIGGPIWEPDSYGYIAEDDTVGRLGAAQFTGIVTLHADTSPEDHSDDATQPSTTGFYGSDEPETLGYNPEDSEMMTRRYEWMSLGHTYPRHAYQVEPSGDFALQSSSPALGTPGGFSAGNGYGPYALPFGDSIRIVWAEAVTGLSRDKCIEIGAKYKNGEIDAYEKNQWVLTGEDSLFQSFRRAIFNHENGYALVSAPQPPTTFTVIDSTDHILLEWTPPQDPSVTGFRLYRSGGHYSNDPILVSETGPSQTSYRDYDVNTGTDYYYYIVSVGQVREADPALGIQETVLTSSRYYTQTYDPVIPGVTGIIDKNPKVIQTYSLKQNYPNPFNPYTTIEYQLPFRSEVKITVYNTLGQRTAVLRDHIQDAGHYKIRFTLSGLPSGIYFCQMAARSTDGMHVFRQTKKILFQK